MATTEARLRVLAIEKDAAIQALSQGQVNRANVELFLVEEKKWKASKPNRLATTLGDAKAKMRNEGLDKG